MLKFISEKILVTDKQFNSNEKIVSDIINTIKKFNMIPESGFIVLGVSGGSDSMCLLDILHK